MRLNLKIFLYTIILLISIVVFLSASNLLYDYLSNKDMKEEEFTPDSILSRQIAAYVLDSDIMTCNKLIDSKLLASNIKRAFYEITGREIDNDIEYRSLILSIMIQETGLRYRKKILPWIPIPETWFYSKSEGIMQAENISNINFYANLVLSIQKLDDIVQIYTHNKSINDHNVKFIFADWCVGSYSCKIASLQSLLNNKISPVPLLSIDGILGKETVSALILLSDYRKTDAEPIIEEGIKNLELKNAHELTKYRETFVRSNYFNKLQQQYPELQTPIIPETRVIDFSYIIRNKLSFETGWLSSKEYAEKAFIIYKKLIAIKS